MSEARNQRFEIDIEEIERQLRRSAEVAPAARPDPLSELARIVGQDDPFGGILGGKRGEPARSNVHPLNRQGQPAPDLDDEVRGVLHGDTDRAAQQAHRAPFDPVAESYGPAEAALLQEDMQPLRPRRSRGRLAGVLVTLLVTTGVVAGGLYWRKSGGAFTSTGAPPVITADKTPLKVAPESPGGMDVPNQDRQIYQRSQTDGQSRVVDGREQPVDVREASRNLPPLPQGGVSARAPVPSSQQNDPIGPVPDGRLAAGAPARGSSAVANALGEPRRVRTVAVRPDGTTYTPAVTGSLSDSVPSLLPGNTLPPPIPVTTVSVPARTTASNGAPNPAAATTGAAPNSVSTSDTPVGGASSSVLPPPRPKLDGRRVTGAAEAPVRVAAVQEPADRPEPAAGRANFSVQVAVRSSAEEAQTAYGQLQSKFAGSLEGKTAQITQAEVGGKTVHRVRVGPMSKNDATALCTKLKSSGGSCFVAGI